ncbi:hypothetical protein PIROE2DRAFT_60147 [Piromyces sp. E2]|nr:hypothetical protein PIROE2DRAFT_60147 [Piromyces sp. E2]|eukprot:OUM65293.1 hypothetical protein PIROE2DRAFT_60147 [Piromyces sp. E2]
MTQNQQNQYIRIQDLNVFKNELNTELNKLLSDKLQKNSNELFNRMAEMLKKIKNNNENNTENNTTFTKYDNDEDDTNTRNGITKQCSEKIESLSKLSTIHLQLIELRQSFGKIHEYIEKFKMYSCCLDIDDSSLSLLFLNGLHPKYRNEIKKAEVLPNTLEEMITQCILYENSLKTNNKVNSHSGNKKNRYNNNKKKK